MNEIIRNDLNPVRLLIQTRDYDKVFRAAWFNRREKEIIVMFGKRKKKEAEGQEMLLRELRGGLEELGGKMDRMQSALDKISQDGEALDDCLTGISDDLDMLDNGLEEWERTLRSQTDSLEDLLDTMEAQSRGETELQQRLSEAEEREAGAAGSGKPHQRPAGYGQPEAVRGCCMVGSVCHDVAGICEASAQCRDSGNRSCG